MRLLAAISLCVLPACLQSVDECPRGRCSASDSGVDAGLGGGAGGGTGGGGGGGSIMRVDGGTWTCRLPAQPSDPWCTDSMNATLRCADATLVGEGRALAV